MVSTLTKRNFLLVQQRRMFLDGLSPLARQLDFALNTVHLESGKALYEQGSDADSLYVVSKHGSDGSIMPFGNAQYLHTCTATHCGSFILHSHPIASKNIAISERFTCAAKPHVDENG